MCPVDMIVRSVIWTHQYYVQFSVLYFDVYIKWTKVAPNKL